MKIKIIGNGAWGNALLNVLQKNSSETSIVGRGEQIGDADVIVLSIPTPAIREVVENIQTTKPTIIVNTAKGIESKTHKLPFEIVRETLKGDVDYYSLIGPSFALEVAKNMPTMVNLGYEKEGPNNKIVKDIFQTDFFRVKLTSAVEPLELSGAFKNIYAIGCGLAQGLGYGVNTRVKLIILAIEELQELFKNLNLSTNSSANPGTIGDLILTCNSSESRNFRFGELLAENDAETCLEKLNSTVEGFNSLNSLEYFENKAKLKLKLGNLIKKVVQEKDSTKKKGYFDEFVRES